MLTIEVEVGQLPEESVMALGQMLSRDPDVSEVDVPRPAIRAGLEPVTALIVAGGAVVGTGLITRLADWFQSRSDCLLVVDARGPTGARRTTVRSAWIPREGHCSYRQQYSSSHRPRRGCCEPRRHRCRHLRRHRSRAAARAGARIRTSGGQGARSGGRPTMSRACHSALHAVCPLPNRTPRLRSGGGSRHSGSARCRTTRPVTEAGRLGRSAVPEKDSREQRRGSPTLTLGTPGSRDVPGRL